MAFEDFCPIEVIFGERVLEVVLALAHLKGHLIWLLFRADWEDHHLNRRAATSEGEGGTAYCVCPRPSDPLAVLLCLALDLAEEALAGVLGLLARRVRGAGALEVGEFGHLLAEIGHVEGVTTLPRYLIEDLVAFIGQFARVGLQLLLRHRQEMRVRTHRLLILRMSRK